MNKYLFLFLRKSGFFLVFKEKEDFLFIILAKKARNFFTLTELKYDKRKTEKKIDQ